MKHKLLGFLFIVAAAAAVVSLAIYWEAANQTNAPLPVHEPKPGEAKPSQSIYKNGEYGFELAYNKNYSLDESGDGTNFFKNSADTIVSVSIPQDLYPKTNFGSATATVAVQEPTSQGACERAVETVTVNDVVFHKSETSGAAAGTKYDTEIYRVFHNDACFEVSLTMGIANIENYEEGAVSAVDKKSISDRLNAIFQTFKFTNLPDTVTCGGFAGLPCPTEGYICALHDNVPDAATICTKKLK
jgi:hypothetical protein